jgi:hypothetical protein
MAVETKLLRRLPKRQRVGKVVPARHSIRRSLRRENPYAQLVALPVEPIIYIIYFGVLMRFCKCFNDKATNTLLTPQILIMLLIVFQLYGADHVTYILLDDSA